MDGKCDKVFAYHRKHRGKIRVSTFRKIRTKPDLSLAYTPGVAKICKEIVASSETARKYTMKSRMVAIVTDGSAVLGLGDIGPLAALPVMEGKAALLYAFAGIEAFPICLDTKDPDEIIRTVECLSPEFAAIMLEDIAAPKCFRIERELQEKLDIPVFHDDQHGTAIVVGSAMINASRYLQKPLEKMTLVVSGTGAAGNNVCKMMRALGIEKIYAFNKDGVVSKNNSDILDPATRGLLESGIVNDPGNIDGLAGLMKDADAFIGVSAPGIVTPEMVASMSEKPIVFALANPDPEISPDTAKAAGAAVVGTGRSDFPNQINNVLVFPGLMRGLLESRAKTVTMDMKKAAAVALAHVIDDKRLNENYLVPDPFDKKATSAVAEAIASFVRK